MIKFIVVSLFFTVLLSCQSQTDQHSAAYRDTIYLDVKGNEYKFLMKIPDSLRTAEQTALLQRLSEVIVKNTSVKNNHMVLDISKEQFVAKGIPERYYHLLQESIRDNNDFFDANGIKNVDSMIRERNEAYDQFKREGDSVLIYK